MSNNVVDEISPPPFWNLGGYPSVPTALYVNIRIQHSERIDGTSTPGTWENWKNKVFHKILSIPLELMIFWFLQMLGKNYVLKINSTNLCCTKPLNLGCFLHGTQHFSTIFLQKKSFIHTFSYPTNPKSKFRTDPLVNLTLVSSWKSATGGTFMVSFKVLQNWADTTKRQPVKC